MIQIMKYQLVKRGPDGNLSTHIFRDELELKTHLEAMWKFTVGYSIISIHLIP